MDYVVMTIIGIVTLLIVAILADMYKTKLEHETRRIEAEYIED